jgi:superfamily II DNA or RNA helicase
MEQFDCRYMLGLSATAYRRDKLTKVIYFYMGDRVCDIEPQELQKINKIMVAKLVVRPTNFDSFVDPTAEYQALITELTENEERNRLIVADVLEEAKNGAGICLVLSDRKSHCERLLEFLVKEGVCVKLLTGETSKKQRESIVRELEQGTVQILVATGSLLGEGFDCKRLSSLFITTPVRFTGRVIQYLGRILRIAEGKAQPTVFDYVDKPGVLRNSFRSRCNAYDKMGVVLASQNAKIGG